VACGRPSSADRPAVSPARPAPTIAILIVAARPVAGSSAAELAVVRNLRRVRVGVERLIRCKVCIRGVRGTMLSPLCLDRTVCRAARAFSPEAYPSAVDGDKTLARREMSAYGPSHPQKAPRRPSWLLRGASPASPQGDRGGKRGFSSPRRALPARRIRAISPRHGGRASVGRRRRHDGHLDIRLSATISRFCPGTNGAGDRRRVLLDEWRR
jgi:hypothetical protein